MTIYVDADACPKAVKEILFRAANRKKIQLVLVANQWLNTPPSLYIQTCVVSKGFDVADNYIAEKVTSGDLVITSDIPLANQVIEKHAQVLNPRGYTYTKENIKQRLATRDQMDELRGSGVHMGGPKPINQREIQLFANALDRYLAK